MRPTFVPAHAPGEAVPPSTQRGVRRALRTCCALLALVGFATLASGCRGGSDGDAGAATVAAVETEYRTLLEAGAARTDPRFELLAKKLETVPAASKSKARADLLRRQLLHARGDVPPRPLAVASPSNEKSTEGACVKEAEAFARAATSNEREAKMKRLRECRTKEAKAQAHQHAEPDPATRGHAHDEGGTQKVAEPPSATH